MNSGYELETAKHFKGTIEDSVLAAELKELSLHKSCSAPALSTLGIAEGNLVRHASEGEQGLNVYVVARPFRQSGGQVFQQLSEDVKHSVVHVGICHYMTVFETADGRLVQFDFGPTGGDIQKGAPLCWILGTERAGNNGLFGFGGRSQVAGEIRERELDMLPETHIYVGRTSLRLSDIRSYNATQSLHYELHKNDCRHYVNSLVEYTTGVQGASLQLVREIFQRKRGQVPAWNAKAVALAQYCTDVQNWDKVKAASSTTMATLLAWTSRGLFSRVATNTLTPAIRVVTTTSKGSGLIRKPVGSAVAAVATSMSWGKIPILRETLLVGSAVNKRVTSVATSAAGWMNWMQAKQPVHEFVDLAMTPSPAPYSVPAALGFNLLKRTRILAHNIMQGATRLMTRRHSSCTTSRKQRRVRQGLLLDTASLGGRFQ